MSATIYRFPRTAGGRQCLRDHLSYLEQFGRPSSPYYVETCDTDWDEIDVWKDEALAILNKMEAR